MPPRTLWSAADADQIKSTCFLPSQPVVKSKSGTSCPRQLLRGKNLAYIIVQEEFESRKPEKIRGMQWQNISSMRSMETVCVIHGSFPWPYSAPVSRRIDPFAPPKMLSLGSALNLRCRFKVGPPACLPAFLPSHRHLRSALLLSNGRADPFRSPFARQIPPAGFRSRAPGGAEVRVETLHEVKGLQRNLSDSGSCCISSKGSLYTTQSVRPNVLIGSC